MFKLASSIIGFVDEPHGGFAVQLIYAAVQGFDPKEMLLPLPFPPGPPVRPGVEDLADQVAVAEPQGIDVTVPELRWLDGPVP